MEQTFIMIKPDGVQRGLVSRIIGRFEKRGYYLKGMKLLTVDRPFAEKHYEDLSARPFFAGLVEYIISGPVVAMVWEGKDIVATGRKMIGATDPLKSDPGTIRGDLSIEIGRNIIHGSDSIEGARKEIALWFPEGLSNWQSNLHPWIYELSKKLGMKLHLTNKKPIRRHVIQTLYVFEQKLALQLTPCSFQNRLK